jgi:hypothetical protein
MISANVMAGELAAAHGEHREAFGKYEVLLGNHIGTKQKGAKRFACRIRAENTGRPVPPQPNHSGL